MHQSHVRDHVRRLGSGVVLGWLCAIAVERLTVFPSVVNSAAPTIFAIENQFVTTISLPEYDAFHTCKLGFSSSKRENGSSLMLNKLS